MDCMTMKEVSKKWFISTMQRISHTLLDGAKKVYFDYALGKGGVLK